MEISDIKNADLKNKICIFLIKKVSPAIRQICFTAFGSEEV